VIVARSMVFFLSSIHQKPPNLTILGE
jgi:hypothetical protein